MGLAPPRPPIHVARSKRLTENAARPRLVRTKAIYIGGARSDEIWYPKVIALRVRYSASAACAALVAAIRRELGLVRVCAHLSLSHAGREVLAFVSRVSLLQSQRPFVHDHHHDRNIRHPDARLPDRRRFFHACLVLRPMVSR